VSHDQLLSAAQEHAVPSMGPSMGRASIPLTAAQLDTTVRQLAAGRIDFTEYPSRVDL